MATKQPYRIGPQGWFWVLHPFLKLTRWKGSRGQVWPKSDPKPKSFHKYRRPVTKLGWISRLTSVAMLAQDL